MGRVYPRGMNIGDEDFVSVYIWNDSANDLYTQCDVWTVDSINMTHFYDGYDMEIIESNGGYGWDRFFKRENEMAKVAPDDKLQLIIQMKVLEHTNESVNVPVSKRIKRDDVVSQNYHQEQLTKDLNLFFNSK